MADEPKGKGGDPQNPPAAPAQQPAGDPSKEGESEEVKKLREENAGLKTDKTNLTEEIKGMRTDLRDAKKALEDKGTAGDNPPVPPQGGGDDVESKVQAALKKERLATKEKNKDKALEKFFETHKEFHPDNDLTGVRLSALERVKTTRLNSEGRDSVEEILADYEAALNFMKPQPKPNEGSGDAGNPYASTPSTPANPPQQPPAQNLTSKEERLRKEKGWTEEKFLKLKSKHPKMVADLLSYQSD